MKRKLNFSFWLFVVLAVLLVIFSVENAGAIEVKVFFKKTTISLAILLIGTFVTGLVCGALYAWWRLIPSKEEEEAEVIEKTDNNKSIQV
jgi:uncharacterized integral membrane protein